MSVRGTLFLIVGPSGAGKDSLIAAARAVLAPSGAHVFPQRRITRARIAGDEDHVEVDREAFDRLEREGAFALSWRAHGLCYGVPLSVTEDLSLGRHVVVNVSREIVLQARQRFALTRVIEVTAAEAVRAARLRQRGREDEASIGSRLARHEAVEPDLTIVNEGTFEKAVALLLSALATVEKRAPGP